MRAVQVETAKRVLDPSKNAGMLRGYRHDEVIAARREAEAEAKEIVEAMADKLKIEDQHAKDALEFAVSVVKNEQVNVKDRLTGAKLVLDFTKARPATKAELEIKKAEDFLDELAKDDTEAARD